MVYGGDTAKLGLFLLYYLTYLAINYITSNLQKIMNKYKHHDGVNFKTKL